MRSTQQLAKKTHVWVILLLVATIVLTIIVPPTNKSKVTFAEKREEATLQSGPQIVSIDFAREIPPPPRPIQPRRKVSKPVPTPQEIVNSLTYIAHDPKPAMKAFEINATYRGWTSKEITLWKIAIQDIMKGESSFCPNVLGGAVLAQKVNCVIKKQGTHSDSGFGQLIYIHYKVSSKNPARGWLCKQEKLCSKEQIIATPWTSMTALVALIERSGISPWCYDARARRHHRVACSNPGPNV